MATKKKTKQEPTTEPRGKEKHPDFGENGYPEKDVKTTGIKIRGTGAATKGVMARGPMA